jgi:hypothetical protein
LFLKGFLSIIFIVTHHFAPQFHFAGEAFVQLAKNEPVRNGRRKNIPLWR